MVCPALSPEHGHFGVRDKDQLFSPDQRIECAGPHSKKERWPCGMKPGGEACLACPPPRGRASFLQNLSQPVGAGRI